MNECQTSRQVVLYIAVSLDGYIAKADGSVDWLYGSGGEDTRYEDFLNSVDTVVMGYATYDQIVNELSPNEWPYEGKRCIVATRREHAPDARVTFVSEDIAAYVAQIKTQPGKDIWLLGGGKLAAPFIKKDMIDEYILTVAPVILGSGISLFQKDNPQLKLKLECSRNIGDMVELCYTRG